MAGEMLERLRAVWLADGNSWVTADDVMASLQENGLDLCTADERKVLEACAEASRRLLAMIEALEADEDGTKKREPRCMCHWEEGDSPCPVHDQEELLAAGARLPFVQTGMVVHHEEEPLSACMLVSELWDDDEGMQATVLSQFGEPGVISCRDLRQCFRLAREFDQRLTYTGRWGRMPRGSVVPEAEVNRDA